VHQLLVAAVLDNTSAIEHENAVKALDGGEAMGDDNRRASG